MARLLKAQRAYIVDQVENAAHASAKAAYDRLCRGTLLKEHYPSYRSGVHYGSPFKEDACGAKEAFLKVVPEIYIPHSWYEKESLAGNFEIAFDTKPCGVGSPNAIIKWKNEEKELKKRQTARRKQLEKMYDKTPDAISEFNYIKMELKKARQAHMDALMLGDEPAALAALKALTKQFKEISEG